MRILGLDLGTNSSSCALWDGQKIVVLPLDGSLSIPSQIFHDALGKVEIGKAAATQSEQTPQNCFQSILRLLGVNRSDLSSLGLNKHSFNRLKAAPEQHTRALVSANSKLLEERLSNTEIWVDDGYRTYAPAQLIAEQLLRLYKMAESRLLLEESNASQNLSTNQNTQAETSKVHTIQGQYLNSKDSNATSGFANEQASSAVNAQASKFAFKESSMDYQLGEDTATSAYLNLPEVKLLITCPAYFNIQQRQTLQEAASLARLSCELISSSTASVLYFGHTLFAQFNKRQSDLNDCLVLMYEWGASRFECVLAALNYRHTGVPVYGSLQDSLQNSANHTQQSQIPYGTIQNNADNVAQIFAGTALDYSGQGMLEVLAVSSAPELGGDEITWALVDLLIKNFQYQYQIDLSASQEAMQRLFAAAEKAKITLSKENSTEILVPYIWKERSQDLHLQQILTREQMHVLYKVFIRKCFVECLKCLELERISFDAISQILIMGGAAQWPLLDEELKGLIRSKDSGSFVENGFLRGFERRELTDVYIPKFIRFDVNQQPAAAGAVLYGALGFGLRKQERKLWELNRGEVSLDGGAYQDSLASDKESFKNNTLSIRLLECVPYAWSIGTSADNAQVVVPKFAPLPAYEQCLLTITEYAKDPLSISSSQAMYYKREKEIAADGKVRATVSVFLRQGRCTVGEFVLPHVQLVTTQIASRRNPRNFFMSDTVALAVAKVKLQLSVLDHDRVMLTLSDTNDPHTAQSWLLPERTLGSNEFKRLQQDLWMEYFIASKQQQLKELSSLSNHELLAYLDTHPELQTMLHINVNSANLMQIKSVSDLSLGTSCTAVPKPDPNMKSEVLPRADLSSNHKIRQNAKQEIELSSNQENKQEDKLETQQSAQLETKQSSNLASDLSNEIKAGQTVDNEQSQRVNQDLEQAVSAARELACRVGKNDTNCSLEILSQVVDQRFAQQLSDILSKAAADLSLYYECSQSLDELKQLLKTALHELQRVKQSSAQELDKTKKFAVEGLLKDFLPVFDALDQSVIFGKEHHIDPAVLQGQVQTLELLTHSLQQHGVKIEDPSGSLFNPQFHQAIAMVETTQIPPKHIARTLQKGLILNGRVVRPAQVMVAKAPAS